MVAGNDFKDINKEGQHQKTKEYILQYLLLTKATYRTSKAYTDIKNMDRHGMIKKVLD